MTKEIPEYAQYLIIGGGAVGCSVAYHLAKLNCKDVLLVERDRLTCGTTWHAAGIVGPLRATLSTTLLTTYASDLFARLPAETGQATGYRQTGGLFVAQTDARMIELQRMADIGNECGLDVHVIGPDEIKNHYPLVEEKDLKGGLWVEQDGQTNPVDTTLAMAKGAKLNGANIMEGVIVNDIEVVDHSVKSVQTNRGRIRCDTLICCAGMWSRHLAQRIGVPLPLQAAEHMYIVTDAMAEVGSNLPVLRDVDGHIYVKADTGKLVIGGFEPVAKPWAVKNIPEDCSFTQLDDDWEHFELFMTSVLKRIPSVADAGINLFMNGPESFTADTAHMIGPMANVHNAFVAAGFNSQGIMASAGAGKALAEWIVEGRPNIDICGLDARRFAPFQATNDYMGQRVKESVGNMMAMHWPYKQFRSCRQLRLSPLHQHLKEQGAFFGEVQGWERPLWFARKGGKPSVAVSNYSYEKQDWWEHAKNEAIATRENVALYELTPFSKFLLQGSDALALLQYLCANDIDVAIGTVVYTQMLNRFGGIECDVTVSRISKESFLMVSAAATSQRDKDWINSNSIDFPNAILTDISSAMAVIGVMGPRSRELLQHISESDFSNTSFPFASTQQVSIGCAIVRATRISFVGELGWELYVPTEFSQYVYSLLFEAGRPFDLSLAGFYTMEGLRLEKSYLHWGSDIGPHDTPFEAGLGFAVALDKQVPFIGQTELKNKMNAGISRNVYKRLVTLCIDSGKPLIYHDEPIYRNGLHVGYVSSGGIGFYLDKSIALGYVKLDGAVVDQQNHIIRFSDDDVVDGDYEILIAGKKYGATPSLKPLYDPMSKRLRN